jgi:heme oxygenase (biliverdin-IX-beta and delta-forming)
MRSANLALEQLRAATTHCHRRLEKRLDVAHRFSSARAYRTYLEVMFGFHAPFEQSLRLHAVRRLLTDYEARCKSSLLYQDLRALAVPPDSIAALPRCPGILLYENEAAALGSLYVLEGATLGGQVLLPLVEQRLQLTRQNGASYLGSYGHNIPVMWKRFCSVVESWCTDGARRATAAAAAVATFESLEAWVCGDAIVAAYGNESRR